MLTLISFFLVLSCKQPLKCPDVKTGDFYYYTKLTRDKVQIQLDDTMQVEIRVDGGTLRSRVVWKNDCSFDIFLNALSKSKLTGRDSALAEIPVRVTIKDVNREYYVCSSKVEEPGLHLEMIDTMFFASPVK